MTDSTGPEVAQPIRGPFLGRLLRAARLDPSLFDEVEADPRALLQATVIVLIGGLARAVLGWASEAGPSLAVCLAGALVQWCVCAALLTSVGVHFFRGTTDFLEMLRTLGFAAAPLWLLALGSLLDGPLRVAFTALVYVWAIGAAFVAVRQALDVGTARALAACGASLGVATLLLLILGDSAGR